MTLEANFLKAQFIHATSKCKSGETHREFTNHAQSRRRFGCRTWELPEAGNRCYNILAHKYWRNLAFEWPTVPLVATYKPSNPWDAVLLHLASIYSSLRSSGMLKFLHMIANFVVTDWTFQQALTMFAIANSTTFYSHSRNQNKQNTSQ